MALNKAYGEQFDANGLLDGLSADCIRKDCEDCENPACRCSCHGGLGLSKCIHCGVYIDVRLGEIAPTGEYHEGTQEDPRAPGDWDNICDVCNYRDGLRGGPA